MKNTSINKSRLISENDFAECYARVIIGELLAKECMEFLGISKSTYYRYASNCSSDTYDKHLSTKFEADVRNYNSLVAQLKIIAETRHNNIDISSYLNTFHMFLSNLRLKFRLYPMEQKKMTEMISQISSFRHSLYNMPQPDKKQLFARIASFLSYISNYRTILEQVEPQDTQTQSKISTFSNKPPPSVAPHPVYDFILHPQHKSLRDLEWVDINDL